MATIFFAKAANAPARPEKTGRAGGRIMSKGIIYAML